MPALHNPKHEEFAKRIACGEGAESAYIAAGYNRKAAALGAATLLETPEIRRRIAELFVPEQYSTSDSVPMGNRLQELCKRREELLRIKEERAQDPDVRRLPAGETGWVIPSWKARKVGIQTFWIVEPRFDRDLARELRTLEEDIARELAREAERHPVVIDESLSKLSDDDIDLGLSLAIKLREAA